jgi:hypothetical protein
LPPREKGDGAGLGRRSVRLLLPLAWERRKEKKIGLFREAKWTFSREGEFGRGG